PAVRSLPRGRPQSWSGDRSPPPGSVPERAQKLRRVFSQAFLEQGPLLQLEIALDQRGTELAGLDIEAQHTPLPQLLETGAPGSEQLLGSRPFVGARDPIDG